MSHSIWLVAALVAVAAGDPPVFDAEEEARRWERAGDPGCAEHLRKFAGFLRAPRSDDEWAIWCAARGSCGPDKFFAPVCNRIEAQDRALEPRLAMAAIERRALLLLELPRSVRGEVNHLEGGVGSFDRLRGLDEPWLALADWKLELRLASDPRSAFSTRYQYLSEQLLPRLYVGHDDYVELRGRPEDAGGPTPLSPGQLAQMVDPLRRSGGLAALPAAERRKLIDLAEEIGLVDHLREIFQRPEFVPEPELRAHATKKLREVVARGYCVLEPSRA